MLEPTAKSSVDALWPPNRLSARERQVLDLAASGMTNLQIAGRLGVTVHAVKFHLAAIYQKLGVANRTEAAYAYLRQGDAGPQSPEVEAH